MHAETFGSDEKFGVEEPLLVLDQRQKLEGSLSAEGLEATLSIAEVPPQGNLEEEVVSPRDEFSLRSPHDMCAVSQSAPDGHVAASGEERGDQGEERSQIG
jgi:hypothetical protein